MEGVVESFPWKVKAKLVQEISTCIKGCLETVLSRGYLIFQGWLGQVTSA